MGLTESEELELLELEAQEAQANTSQPAQQVQPEPSFMDTVGSAAKSLIPSPSSFTPEELSKQAPMLGTMAGSAFGGLGAPIGAGVGQTVKRMADIAYGRVPPSEAMNQPGQLANWRESISPMTQTALAGITDVAGIVPKWLGGNPGKTTIAQKMGQGLAKLGETLSGAKKDILTQGYKQGYSTYRAPTMEQAKQAFGEAIGPEGQAALKPTAEDAFDAALGKARKLATEIGTKVESGQPVNALEALQARQATDRIISATTPTDTDTLGILYGWRKKFDTIMTSQSDALAGASKQYRQAIVRDTLLEPTRITKSGRPSAFLPMIMGAGGRGIEGTVGMMTGTSPLAWGFGATTVGQIAKIPSTIRKALITQFIQNRSQGSQQ